MNKLYGTMIFFFYFIKYPLVIFLPILYLYLDYPNDIILNILYFISFALIIKDIFFPLDNCTLKNK
ncbi:MAG: hypothetical protein HRT40_00275 [Campylobacteraceae bacterium]|nr:hypothetical protein [Campylobacteraceae bacterium]